MKMLKVIEKRPVAYFIAVKLYGNDEEQTL